MIMSTKQQQKYKEHREKLDKFMRGMYSLLIEIAMCKMRNVIIM